jgi:hypothetical protein
MSRVTNYLSQPYISGSLIYCRLLTSLGRTRDAQSRLTEIFEKLDFKVLSGPDAGMRRRARVVGDAVTWLAESFRAESNQDNGIAFFKRMLKRNPGSEVLYKGLC